MRSILRLGLVMMLSGCSGDDSNLQANGGQCTHHWECQSGFCQGTPTGQCEPKAGMFESCLEDQHCQSGSCRSLLGGYRRICTVFCQTDDDCEGTGGVCADGECAPRCENNEEVERGACVDGRPVRCSEVVAKETDCVECGCTDDKFCNEQSQCELRFPYGHACSEHTQCQSNNCDVPYKATRSGSTSKLCLVGIGESCTDDNCGACADGGTFCSRSECVSPSDCAPPPGSPYRTTCVEGVISTHCASLCTSSSDCVRWGKDKQCVEFVFDDGHDDGTCVNPE